MPLDDRRLAMLREMGVPFWQPLARAEVTDQDEAETEARREAPALALHTAPVEAEVPAESRPGPSSRPPASRPTPHAVEAAAGRSAPVELRPALPQAVPASGSLGQSALEVSALGWPELRQAVADCRACGLCEKRRQTVFGVGHPHAHWMVVGEAPGEQEDLRGEPFVGPAGRLLDQMLAALGLTRAETSPEGAPPLTPERQVYIANTLKCRPPGNRNPEPTELARCEPFLVRQIELVQPRVILAMGRFAVQALLRTDEPIGRLRGRVHRYQGVPLIVTYHPAYLLRNLLDKAKAWDDLCLAMATMEGLSPWAPSSAAANQAR